MEARIKAQVRERAGNACEYCRLHQDDSPLAVLHIEHIIPKIHGGSEDLDNLALACIDCNLHKGTNLTGIDPETDGVTELFHPRRQKWDDHFEWQGISLNGKTAIGRTTIRVLNMNSEDQLALRSGRRISVAVKVLMRTQSEKAAVFQALYEREGECGSRRRFRRCMFGVSVETHVVYQRGPTACVCVYASGALCLQLT